MATAAGFEGFPRALPDFLGNLVENNDKRWFDAHRSLYEELYLEPARRFAEAIGPELRRIAPGLRSEARVNGSIMKIHRDTRFSKDKTPFKDALHMLFSEGSGAMRAAPGFYFRIAPQTLGLAAGIMAFSDRQLARYREAVRDPKACAALGRAVDRARKAGPCELGEPALKRVPRGFDPEHPAAHWLRFKGLTVGGDRPLPRELFGPKCVPWCVERFRELRPVQKWLVDHIGPA
jgi:uncharacterized protein (TIGR02453 family)